jgi:hypothetical protein
MAAPPDMAAILLRMMDDVRAFGETVKGYREQLEQLGFSPTAAEAMAVHLHHELVTAAFRPKVATP